MSGSQVHSVHEYNSIRNFNCHLILYRCITLNRVLKWIQFEKIQYINQDQNSTEVTGHMHFTPLPYHPPLSYSILAYPILPLMLWLNTKIWKWYSENGEKHPSSIHIKSAPPCMKKAHIMISVNFMYCQVSNIDWVLMCQWKSVSLNLHVYLHLKYTWRHIERNLH